MESTSEVSCTNTESTTMTCDSTESISENSCSSVESTARTRFTRGISLKACVAKAAGWTLEKAKDITLPDIKECKTT
jgi:hypothetical protein